MNCKKIMDLFQLIIIAPLLWLLATDRFPERYKFFVVWLAFILGLFYLYQLFFVGNGKNQEGMKNIFGSNVHNLRIFDSMPGYDVPNLNVKLNDIVVWTNIGEKQHTITSIDNRFNSGYLKPGDSYSIKFTEPGEFFYNSLLDSGWMKGVVVVK